MARKKLKIWHISDTHTYHRFLTVPKEVDIVIFSGDCSNPKTIYINEPEVRDFMKWFSELPIKYKIFVAGNHDTSIEAGLITKQDFEDLGIIYLENDYVEIEGFKFFGSPNQPRFGSGWAFNKEREEFEEHWANIDVDVDVFIVHGPPRTILDLNYSRKDGSLEHCGCKYLTNNLLHRIRPRLVCFGHIHNCENIINAGVLKLSHYDTIFSNGSIVTDNKFGMITSNGNILEL